MIYADSVDEVSAAKWSMTLVRINAQQSLGSQFAPGQVMWAEELAAYGDPWEMEYAQMDIEDYAEGYFAGF